MLESKAVVYGATGVIGQELTRQLAEQGYEVTVVVRKESDRFGSDIHQVIVNDQQYNQGDLVRNARVFVAIGTTSAKTPNKEEYYQIDHDIPVTIAESCSDNEAHSLHVVSATGADPSSSVRYNRIKGEMERDVSSIFGSSYFYRPSLLLGEREEKRTGESIAKFLFKYFSWLVPASFKGIHPDQVARVMVHHAKTNSEKRIWESMEMRKF